MTSSSAAPAPPGAPPHGSARRNESARRSLTGALLTVSLPILAVGAALLIGAVMLLLLNANPIAAYGSLVQGAVGSMSGITQSLVKATPLLLVGLGICIAFRASVINIGAEGQIILGALMATWFSLPSASGRAGS